MGQGSSKGVCLRDGRFYVDATLIASLAGFNDDVPGLLDSLRQRNAKVAAISSLTKPAALLDHVTVQQGAKLPINEFVDTVSVGDTYRIVTPARVDKLMESFYKKGIQLLTGTSLQLCLFLHPDENDQVSCEFFVTSLFRMKLKGCWTNLSAGKQRSQCWRSERKKRLVCKQRAQSYQPF